MCVYVSCADLLGVTIKRQIALPSLRPHKGKEALYKYKEGIAMVLL